MEMTMKVAIIKSALLLGAIIVGSSGSAQAGPFQECLDSGVSRANCACERALRVGSDAALQSFMDTYNARGTACAATNTTAMSGGGGVRLEIGNIGGELHPGGSN
jgi:hypothetical protein